MLFLMILLCWFLCPQIFNVAKDHALVFERLSWLFGIFLSNPIFIGEAIFPIVIK